MDKWRLSFACLASRSEDSCVGLPRLYEIGPGGTGWNRETASWRLGEGLQDVILCVPGGAHSKNQHCCKSTVTEEALLRYLMFCGFGFCTTKHLVSR
jgi:hypothetical protein